MINSITTLYDELKEEWNYNISEKYLESFLNKLWIENVWSRNSLVSKLKDYFSHYESKKLIYKKIWNILKEDKEFELNFLKDKKIEEFSWEILTCDVDLKKSTNSIEVKDIMKNVFSLTSLFEEKFSDLSFKAFYIQWDRLMFAFFSEWEKEKKLEIVKLYLVLLELLTNKEFHINLFNWDKKSWDSIYALFDSLVVNTVNSNSFNEKYKKIEKHWLENYVDIEIIDSLVLGENESLPKWIDGLNIQIHKNIKVHAKQALEDILNLDFDIEKVLRRILVNLIWNNTQNNEAEKFKNQIKVETIPKWEILTTFWEKVDDLYLVLDGKVKITPYDEEDLSKIINAKTIIGETSLKNKVANATTKVESDVKVIKIPQEIIKVILSWKAWNQVKNDLERLLNIYINLRESENIIKNKNIKFIRETLWNKYSDLFLDVFYRLFSKTEAIIAQRKLVVEEWKTNNKLFFIKAGSIIKMIKQDKVVYETLANDMIVGENTFLTYLNGVDWKANASVEILEWVYQEIDFKKAEKQLFTIRDKVKNLFSIGKLPKTVLESLRQVRNNYKFIINPSTNKKSA